MGTAGNARLRGRAPAALIPAAALVLAVAVLYPAFGGHVYLLDWVYGRHGGLLSRATYGLDGGVAAGAPLTDLMTWLTHLAGSAAELAPYVLFFPLAAVSAARLTGGSLFRQACAALLMTVNPFVFDRIAAGQISVLLGYALVPFAVRAALRGPEARGVRRLETAAWWAGAAALSVHFLWITGIVTIAVVIVRRLSRSALAWFALNAAATALLSAYLFFTQAGQARPVTVGGADLAEYATQRDPHVGLFVNVLGLYGFWRRGPQLPKDVVSPWLVLLAVLLLLVVAGAVAGVRDPERRPLALVLLVSGAVAYFLALGAQGPTGPVFRAFYDHVPLFDVMREPQKFLALTAVSYAVLFGWGVTSALGTVGSRPARVVVAIVLALLPLEYSPTLLAGLNGQVTAVQVPAGYAQADALMGQGAGQVLALPWHQYESFPWTGRVVANPLPTLFDRTVISGDDVELPGLQTTSTSTRSAYLEFLYAHGAETHHFGALVAGLGVQFVVLAKTVDWQSYSWLGRQADLRKVLDNADLVVYETTEPADLGHRVAGTVTVADWGQLLALADAEDVSRLAVVATHEGPGPVALPATVPAVPAAGTASARRTSPVRFALPAGHGWVTVAEPYDRAWRVGRARPVQLADGTMAFDSPAGQAKFTHWPLAALGWLVSFACAAVDLGLSIRWFASVRARNVPGGSRDASSADL